MESVLKEKLKKEVGNQKSLSNDIHNEVERKSSKKSEVEKI